MLSLFSVAMPMLWLPFISFVFCMEQGAEKEQDSRSLPPLAEIEPFVISDLQKGKFALGKEAWNATRETYAKCNSPRLVENQELVQHLEFAALIDMMKDLPKSAVVAVAYPKAFAELTLSCLVSRKSIALYLILSYYIQMVLELRTLVNEMWDATPYQRLELGKFKNLLKDVVCLFHFAEALIKAVHGREDAEYDRNAVVCHLEHQFYVSDEKIACEKERYINTVKENFKASITLYEYIVLTSRYYAIYFSNIYCMVQAHLDEREDKRAVKSLNKQGLKRRNSSPSYDLTSCDFAALVKALCAEDNQPPKVRDPNMLFMLNEMLEEGDGEARDGMKTRQFLKVVGTLNELGFFQSFIAADKVIYIKTQPSPMAPKGVVTKLKVRPQSNHPA